MCRACFSTVMLHDDLFEGGASRVFANLSGAPMPTRRTLMALSAGAAGAAATMTAPRIARAAAGAEVIFRGGKVLPMPGAASAQALAIGGGKILAVGSEEEVGGLKSPNTRIVDLAGRVLMPGFIDPHSHSVLSAVILEMLTDVGYTTYPTRAKLMEALRSHGAQVPAGEWLAVSNFDNLLQGGGLTRTELDAISTDRPIFVWYTNGHDACVNSLALKMAGIPEDVGMLPGGGHFGRAPDGRLDGQVFEEAAIFKFLPMVLPKITTESAGKALEAFLRKAAASGNTTLHEPGTLKSAWIAAFAKASSTFPCRTSASLMYEDMKGYEPYRALGIGAKATILPDSLFSLYGVKIVGDGSDQTRTGAQTVPYLGTSDKGKPNFDAAQMKKMVADVKAMGSCVQIHCNGDYTIDIALDAIEAAYGNSTAQGINRIEHSTIARPDQIGRMKALNVQPSFLMNHVRFYGAAYRDQIFGPARAALTDSAGACVRAGVPFTLHTDSPCSPLGALNLVSTAITRRCVVDSSVIGPEQAVTLDQALRAVTIDAARQIGQGGRIGSLEKDKEADLVLLEADPYATAPDKLGAIKVSETWVAGWQRYVS
ncbi:MAG: amidohydrolase [Hyphomicrobiales bacterium]